MNKYDDSKKHISMNELGSLVVGTSLILMRKAVFIYSIITFGKNIFHLLIMGNLNCRINYYVTKKKKSRSI